MPSPSTDSNFVIYCGGKVELSAVAQSSHGEFLVKKFHWRIVNSFSHRFGIQGLSQIA